MQDDWVQSVERRLAVLELQMAREEVHRGNVGSRLSAIEDTLKWLVRLILGGVLMGALAFLLQGGLAS